MEKIKRQTMEILSAEWVIPVATPVIGDGSVVVDRGRIIAVGKRADILCKYQGIEERRCDSVLMPGLVNGHMHLELSHVRDITPPPAENAFTDWISELITIRQNDTVTRSQVVVAFTSILLDQYASGVALVADIGNEFFSELSGQVSDGWPEVLRLVECLGPNRQAILTAKEKISNLSDRYPVCVHAPYSTGPDLFVYSKQRCRRLGHLFSVHAAESSAEIEFLRFGTGCFRNFLEKRKSWDGTFSFAEEGFAGTVFYFDHLGILDEKTLLVHAVHVSEQELSLVAKRGAHICLCPGSNMFLGVGKAPIEKMIKAGILPALGTDSPASNVTIDLWREMKLLAAEHPRVAHESILAMATLGGAQALNRWKDYGSITQGRRSQIIQVSSPALKRCTDISQVVRQLVTGGRPNEISWISTIN
ncbi:MAG: amidohydrolase family protein [Proteobacteria bacterium]|nr:amidohydrolase family protein [Pseudomonadota bacterium]